MRLSLSLEEVLQGVTKKIKLRRLGRYPVLPAVDDGTVVPEQVDPQHLVTGLAEFPADLREEGLADRAWRELQQLEEELQSLET